jgi:ArsR family metal-binding transcriptional regulator
MQLSGYGLEIFRSKCHPDDDVIHGHAHWDTDISEALPYLNAKLGGDTYCVDPPSLTFRWHGKLVTLHSKLVAINALRDEEEAHAILRVLVEEINSVWERRDTIIPSFQTLKQPQAMEILKRLPRTNCVDCGQPTCTVFAIHVTQGIRTMSDCGWVSIEDRRLLEQYLSPFQPSVDTIVESEATDAATECIRYH